MTTTLDTLALWLVSLKIRKVDQFRKDRPDGHMAYTTPSQSQVLPYFTISSFPSEATGGGPASILIAHPLVAATDADPDCHYTDGSIVFEAEEATGVICSIYFGESYAGGVFRDWTGEGQPVPNTLDELLQLIEAFRKDFERMLREMPQPC